ncbi:hypothetical protein GCM10010452_42190 [Crossiella cryophila]
MPILFLFQGGENRVMATGSWPANGSGKAAVHALNGSRGIGQAEQTFVGILSELTLPGRS